MFTSSWRRRTIRQLFVRRYKWNIVIEIWKIDGSATLLLSEVIQRPRLLKNAEVVIGQACMQGSQLATADNNHKIPFTCFVGHALLDGLLISNFIRMRCTLCKDRPCNWSRGLVEFRAKIQNNFLNASCASRRSCQLAVLNVKTSVMKQKDSTEVERWIGLPKWKHFGDECQAAE